MDTPYRVPAGTGIGHVHLKVADIDRALAFYRDVLGFDQVMRLGWKMMLPLALLNVAVTALIIVAAQ